MVLGGVPFVVCADRFVGRDLRIATAVRTVLADHLNLARSMVDHKIQPGSARLPPLDLLRA